MAVLVDTNIIIDQAVDDPVWADWSENKLSIYREGGLWINDVVFAELCVGAPSLAQVRGLTDALGLHRTPLPDEALFLAGQAFRRYRQQGGLRSSPLPDFFIGGQAEALAVPLLTRDANRYRTYFPKIELIAPD